MLRKELQLFISVGGIYFCYFNVGLIEEHLFKSNFGSLDSNPSPKFEFSSILIFLQMLLQNLLCMAMIFRNKIKFVCTIKEGAYLGLINFTSMIGTLTALQYVSFPFQALVKSCTQVFMKNLLNPLCVSSWIIIWKSNTYKITNTMWFNNFSRNLCLQYE
ncbi:unnamed protein product [Paramecium sonneborni]|uniref:Uncharacterized protein n=1 Tax=Paramecium sonneborni TaxID=65129 RepID=A0A8S1M2R2_9CILI|nr:unnamed protein product [Paramecium sonneborni]